MTHTTPDHATRRAGGAVVPVLAFAGIVVAVMQTLLVPVIKDLPQLLGTAPSNATWVLTSTLLSGAVATPIMGRLGDLYGKRRMLILSLSVMVVGALVSAFTSQLLLMIVGRALQGFAMGAIPLGIGLMRDMLPARAARLRDGADELLHRRRRRPRAARRRPGRPAHRLARPVLRRRRPRRARHRPDPRSSSPSPRRAPRAPSTARARSASPPVWCCSCCRSPRAATGAGPPAPRSACSARAARRPRAVGRRGAAHHGPAGRPAHHRPPRGAAHQPRLDHGRRQLLRRLAGPARSCSSCRRPPATASGQSMVVAGLCVAPLGLTMMFTAPVYARLSARCGPQDHPDHRHADHRDRLRRAASA